MTKPTNSKNSKSSITLNIDSNQLNQLMEILNTLNITQIQQPETTEVVQVSQDVNMEEQGQENREILYTVTDVVDYRIVNNNFQFLLKFKGYKDPEWIDDDKCMCHEMINTFLKKRGIKTAYIFCRVSTQEQAQENNTSLAFQEQELRNVINSQLFGNFNRIVCYNITGSAYKSLPPQLEEIGRYANTKDIILVWRVDRLSRNLKYSINWLDDINNRGVIIYSHFERFTYSDRRLDFLEAIIHAEREAQNLGHRVKASVNFRKQRDGRIGKPGYGYKLEIQSSSDGTIVRKKCIIDKVEMTIIERINNLYLDNKSYTYICNLLNLEGILKRGKIWKPSMIRSLITQQSRNTRYNV